MDDVSETTPCARCGYQSEDYREFIITSDDKFVCEDVKACQYRKRRADRTAAIFRKRKAEGAEMRTAKVVRKDPGRDAIFWRDGIEGLSDVELIINWVANRHANAVRQTALGHQIKITTDGGQVYLRPGQWLVEILAGEFEVCSEKSFVERYDIVGGL